MSNYFLDRNDWRKQAAMTAVNDLDIEKAFADQSSGFVENKLAPLMKDPYNIGFEIVRKNDENTRIIGIYAFKVEDHLLFAPVFFLNGDIKGPLLYRCDSKTFVPANKEWATFLIESLEVDEGHGQPLNKRVDSAPLVQMQRINFTPSNVTKQASVKTTGNKPACTCPHIPAPDGNSKVVVEVQPDYSNVANANKRLPGGESLLKMAAKDDGTIRCEFADETFCLSVDDSRRVCDVEELFNDREATITTPSGVMLKLASVAKMRVKTAFFDNIPHNLDRWLDEVEGYMDKFAALGQSDGSLREFLQEPGVGQAASEAIIKAASEHYDFAEQLAELYGAPENLFPESFTPIEKKAAEKKGALVIKYDVKDLPSDDSIKSEYFRDGFYILDSRPKGALATVQEKSTMDLTTVTEPGVYTILKSDGSFIEDVFVAQYGGSDNKCGCVAREDLGESRLVWAAIKDGKALVARTLIGLKTGTDKTYKGLQDTVQKGRTYVLYIDGFAIGPFYVASASRADGVTYATIHRGEDSWTYSDNSQTTLRGFYNRNSEGQNITINPEVSKSNRDAGLYGKDAAFVEVQYTTDQFSGRNLTAREFERDGGFYRIDKLEGIGNHKSLDKFIFESWKAPSIEIVKGVTKEAAYKFRSEGKESVGMNKCQAMVKLARDMNIAAPVAYDLLHKVDANGNVAFYVAGLEKMATKLRVVDRPTFDDEFDSEFGIPMQPTKEYNLRVQGDQMFEQPSAIGDAMNPTTVTGLPNATVVSVNPTDLRALADTYKLPHVFEHSVVGSLADTFNAMALLDKYVPRIEDAVDSLFRLLFLIYWRPGDFETVYGADDMMNLESETISNGEALGAMLLRLLKKTELQRKGKTRNQLVQEQGQR